MCAMMRVNSQTLQEMKMPTNETATKRIAVTPTTFENVKDFTNGLSVTYDEALDFLLRSVMQPDEDALMAGRRLRSEFNARKRDAKEG